MKYFLLCTLWIVWCFLHSFLITTKTTAWLKNRLGDKFAFCRISYNLFSAATVLLLLYWQYTIQGPVVIKLSPLLLMFKYAALSLSAIIIVGSFVTFDVLEFAGIRQIIKKRLMDERRETKTEKQVIKKHGFYGVVRHPIYFGGFIFFTVSMTHAPLAQFLGYGILVLYMIIGTFREDKRLANELGDVYRNYQREVPMIFPRILGGKADK